MSKLDRLLGKLPPEIPAGGRVYVSMDAPDGSAWSVRVETVDGKSKRVSPSFTRQTTAYSYLDWVEGVADTFEYPADGAA